MRKSKSKGRKSRSISRSKAIRRRNLKALRNRHAGWPWSSSKPNTTRAEAQKYLDTVNTKGPKIPERELTFTEVKDIAPRLNNAYLHFGKSEKLFRLLDIFIQKHGGGIRGLANLIRMFHEARLRKELINYLAKRLVEKQKENKAVRSRVRKEVAYAGRRASKEKERHCANLKREKENQEILLANIEKKFKEDTASFEKLLKQTFEQWRALLIPEIQKVVEKQNRDKFLYEETESSLQKRDTTPPAKARLLRKKAELLREFPKNQKTYDDLIRQHNDPRVFLQRQKAIAEKLKQLTDFRKLKRRKLDDLLKKIEEECPVFSLDHFPRPPGNGGSAQTELERRLAALRPPARSRSPSPSPHRSRSSSVSSGDLSGIHISDEEFDNWLNSEDSSPSPSPRPARPVPQPPGGGSQRATDDFDALAARFHQLSRRPKS